MAEQLQHNGNSHHDPERNGAQHLDPRRPWYKALVQDLDPIWFTWCMNTGILGILYHQYNYRFPGLYVLSTIAFVIDLVLFIIFSSIYILRFVIFKKQAWRELVDSPKDLPLFSCWPIAWLTLCALVSLIVSPADWGGYSFTVVAYVMWWIGVVWILASLFFVFITLINLHQLGSEVEQAQLPPSVIIPAVSVATLALTGGIVSSYSTGISAHLAVPIIILSFTLVGIGIFMATLLYAFLLHQLLAKGWIAPEMTPNIFMLVGPMGQSAAALQVLGSSASIFSNFAHYSQGSFLTASSASALATACTWFALILSGMGTFWLIISFYAMFHRAFQRQLAWTPNWNAIIFPTGTLATSMIQFGVDMNAPFFKVIAGILLVFLTIVWFINLGFTIYQIATRKLLITKEDPRVKKQIEEQQQQKKE